ncbi:MAG: XdhC family protein [Devosia sp.]
MLASDTVPEIRRPLDAGLDGDDPASAFALLESGRQRGLAGVLITIVGVDGGAPRTLGSHMAVLEDGSFVGYISGGCVEASVAAEALTVFAAGKDAVLRFGRNSPFMDIRLPCGGGIDLHMHVRPDPQMVSGALEAIARRESFAIDFAPKASRATLVRGTDPGGPSDWRNGAFRRRYLPRTRLALVGRGLEFEAMMRVGRAAGLDVLAFTPDEHGLAVAQSLHVPVTQLVSLGHVPPLPVDRWTAVVFLFHDHDWESALLGQALATDAFFIGALGSTRTQARRREHLAHAGLTDAQIGRVRGPIGLFGPTRDSTSLTLSVLAEIASERIAAEAA